MEEVGGGVAGEVRGLWGEEMVQPATNSQSVAISESGRRNLLVLVSWAAVIVLQMLFGYCLVCPVSRIIRKVFNEENLSMPC